MTLIQRRNNVVWTVGRPTGDGIDPDVHSLSVSPSRGERYTYWCARAPDGILSVTVCVCVTAPRIVSIPTSL